MAGTIDLLQRGFTGIETRADALWLDPACCDELAELRFRLRYRDHYGVNVTVSAIGSPSADSRARCGCESRTKA